MKCPNCGYEAPIFDFLDEWLRQHRNENGHLPDDFTDAGGKACPKCREEV